MHFFTGSQITSLPGSGVPYSHSRLIISLRNSTQFSVDRCRCDVLPRLIRNALISQTAVGPAPRLPLQPLFADNPRLHLFDNTRCTVANHAELTLYARNSTLCVSSAQPHRLIEQRIQFLSHRNSPTTFAFAVGDAQHRASRAFPVLHHGA